ncbi:hypothetical protein E2C01_049558 [Portunus trituberculatus]|uniref:Uncharacterized protein n=1 Tax=Portunus trituberculatus TaxID=210409 RepID=A0A5B7GE22_PORTR|nr:hypothetical protein [Portunus trituberculatus]
MVTLLQNNEGEGTLHKDDIGMNNTLHSILSRVINTIIQSSVLTLPCTAEPLMSVFYLFVFGEADSTPTISNADHS